MHNEHDLEAVMVLGSKNRSVGATLMNVDSSRSHSILTIEIEMIEEFQGESKLRVGQLNLVDLAGSERQSKTGSTGKLIFKETEVIVQGCYYWMIHSMLQQVFVYICTYVRNTCMEELYRSKQCYPNCHYLN